MKEDEDSVLLSSLGVTSANPEDIERVVLEEARNNADKGGSTEEEPLDKLENTNPSSANQAKLYSKLRAVKFEIDAVASTVEEVTDVVSGKHQTSDDDDDGAKKRDKGDDESGVQVSPDDTLQHALAADRLRSLKRTKAKLEKELSDLRKDDATEGVEHEKLLANLVKEDPRPKKKSKKVLKSGKNKEKQQKTVSFADDADFDSMLDGVSSGFVETERDELVRKGILTPFHQLKGFERCLQQPGSSSGKNECNEEDKTDGPDSDSVVRAAHSMLEAAKARPTTKLLDSEALPKLDAPTRPFQRLKTPMKACQSPERDAEKRKGSDRKRKRPLPGKKWRKSASSEDMGESVDSGRDLHTSISEEDVDDGYDNDSPFITLEGGLKIPEAIFRKLFDYQKVGVQWLWELHCQRAGGIIGDEMGLGKTIQVLSFLGALHFSNMYKPSIVVCPVTLLRQWKREAQKWYPRFHVELLHDSAQDVSSRDPLKKKRAQSYESDCETEDSLDSDYERSMPSRKANKWDSLINRVFESDSGLLITTYEQLRLLGEKLLDFEWGYAVLDEGHRIRNPNAEITLAEFAVPISVGGYANASPLQVSTAYRCAVVLRDMIMPYLLRRMKMDVNAQLPKKTEHVLFCSLTSEQRSVYRAFLASTEVENILDGSRNSLYGIDVMRKICNHPDLLEREHSCHNPDYGNPERSGKMKVVAQVLKAWQEQGHRVLLFTQTQQMLDIFESFLNSGGYNYRRMDGSTPIRLRMSLIDEFNNSSDVFIFILTTKVGGLGTNLTGANRVIIFDPDWNPSTDMQARERAWRIGQKRDVTVYRLITRGTIEEKVYHRQIYKHFLTNKILKNPQQRRFFRARDMKDLFMLTDDGEGGSTETSNIFGQLSEDVNVVGTKKEKLNKRKKNRGIAQHADNENNSETRASSREEKEKAGCSDGEVDEETNILKSLFAANGIHSAVNHDVIMNAHDEEKIRLEEQASQVAQRAAEALRQSRMLRSRDSISVPTWTGKSGTAGAPSSFRQKFGSTVNSQLIKSSDSSSSNKTTNLNGIAAGASAGKALSSAELLARIRGNQERAVGAGLDQQFGFASSSGNTARSENSGASRPPQTLSSVQPEILIRQICTFIQRQGGSSDSSSIVQHFKDRIPSKDLPIFKNLLKEIALLREDPNGKQWVLKPEYQ
ncbi:hypothetical protein OIU77_020092 [Salix suchowensis]|uniref:Protein CHROMATIN REMODELING 8 n=1 Tax=Salix suchowensis TaxID=1278906 RepID=A0ABQ9CID5_9ROSI|nr:hypothetical protein OIU77_020092 [Salix suchowensis]